MLMLTAVLVKYLDTCRR